MIVPMAWILGLALLAAAGCVASYLRLLMRRLTSVGARKLFHSDERRWLQADRERVGVSISALHGATMALFSVGLTGLLVWQAPSYLAEDLGVSLLIVLGVINLFDQLIPFRLVAHRDDPEVILANWMPFLRLAVVLAVPLTFPVLISTTISRLLETDQPEPEQPSPQEELQELIETGTQEGLIERSEGEMIQSVVDFSDKVVREVMTPRPEIAAIEINASLDDLRRLFRERRQTRYPVYNNQLDNIEGIVNVQDLLGLRPEEQAKATLRSLVRPVPFVPETKLIRNLLKELQQSTTQLAVVVDEYGSVAGLVTIEDMLEEIVGEIRDQVEPHAHDIVRESADKYLVAGQTELAQIEDRFHVTLDGGDYSTVAGLILAQLGHVPAKGEIVEINGLSFEVLEADQRTVLKICMKVLPATRESPRAHAESDAH